MRVSLNLHNQVVSNGLKQNRKNEKQMNFEGIDVLRIADNFSSSRSKIVSETEKFINAKKGARSLGKGLFAEVFELLGLSGVVLKSSFGSDDFSQEANSMINAPDELRSSQKFVARLRDDNTGKYYLLSTKVNGDAADFRRNPWTKNSLRNLFNSMFEMDKKGFYHGDLNNGNIRLDSNGNVGFIDYQFAENTSSVFNEKEKMILPDFIPVENSQMFEMAGIPYYLRDIGNSSKAKSFLKTYLEAKSEYHKKRADFFSGAYSYYSSTKQQAIDFEKAQAEVFKNPTDDVLKLEAQKIQFLNSFREAYKHIDANIVNKNIIPAGSAYLNTLSNIQAFRQEVARQQARTSSGTYKYDYLKGLEAYGDFWYKNVSSWTEDAFNFPLRHTSGNLQNWERMHNFDNPNVDIDKFKSMLNVTSFVAPEFEPKYTRNLDMKDYYTNDLIQSIQKNIRGSKYGGMTSAIHSLQNGVTDTAQRFQRSYDNNYGLDVINNALLLIRRTQEADDKAYWMTISSSSDSRFISSFRSGLSDAKDNLITFTKKVFNNIFYDIKNNGASSSTLPGYKGMNDFS